MPETTKIVKCTGRGHKVIKPCPHCGERLSYTERRDHVSRCLKNPLSVECPFCASRVNLRMGFRDHFDHGCRNPPQILTDEKFCAGCMRIHHISAFAKDFRANDFHHAQCKLCHNGKTQVTRQDPAAKLKHRHTNIHWRYGVTRDQYDAMLAAQSGLCAICGLPPGGNGPKDRYLHVDHTHDAAKRVRALLCLNCNHLIGKAKDDPERCLAAARYLLRHRSEMFQEAHTG